MPSFPIPVHDDDHSSLASLSSFSSMPSLVDGASIIEDDLADAGNGLTSNSGFQWLQHHTSHHSIHWPHFYLHINWPPFTHFHVHNPLPTVLASPIYSLSLSFVPLFNGCRGKPPHHALHHIDVHNTAQYRDVSDTHRWVISLSITPQYRAVCDGQRDNLVVTDTPRYITWCVTDIDGGQAVCNGPRDNPVVTNTPRYITQCASVTGFT